MSQENRYSNIPPPGSVGSEPPAAGQAPGGQGTPSGGQAAPPPQGYPGSSGRGGPPPARDPFQPFDPRSKSPGLASFLSLMPGLGQIYVGYYQRGFVHILVFAGIVAVLNTRLPEPLYPLFGIFLAFFILYNIIDAGRRAAFYNQALQGSPTAMPEFDMPGAKGSLMGGITAIIIGGVLLVHTVGDLSLRWLEDWWPVIPILFGVYLVAKSVQEKAGPAPGAGRGTGLE